MLLLNIKHRATLSLRYLKVHTVHVLFSGTLSNSCQRLWITRLTMCYINQRPCNRCQTETVGVLARTFKVCVFRKVLRSVIIQIFYFPLSYFSWQIETHGCIYFIDNAIVGMVENRLVVTTAINPRRVKRPIMTMFGTNLVKVNKFLS